MKQKGFTVIELLTAIVIIGILATAGVAVYTGQINKANDARRMDNMVQILNYLKRDSIINKNGSDTYIYNETEIEEVLAKVNYDALTNGEELCYYIGFAEGANTGSGSDNEIVVATWAEGSGEVLAVGTDQAVTNLTSAPTGTDCICNLNRANFLCEDPNAIGVAQLYFVRPDDGDGFNYEDVNNYLGGSSCNSCTGYPDFPS